jgi:hypothetical protein
MNTYPIYLLNLGGKLTVVLPEPRTDVGHTEFWESTVSQIVADHYGIPRQLLLNLPYCQRRARIVGNVVYYGGKPNPKLLRLIRKAIGNRKLVFRYDDHERRLRHDVIRFHKLVRHFRRTRG